MHSAGTEAGADTAAEAAEAALREGERRIRDLADTSPAILWLTDAANRTTFLNRAWYEYTGQASREGIGFGWLDAVHPDQRDRVKRQFLEAARRQQPFSINCRLRRSDGEYRWVLDQGRPRFGRDGDCQGYTGCVVDVHEHKRDAEALRASEERYALINRATNDVIWDWDLDTDGLEWNEAARDHFGYTSEELGTDISGWYDRLHPEDRDRVFAGIHAAIDSGASVWAQEYRFLRRDGSYATFLDRGYIGRDTSGRPHRMIGSMLDLTERKQAEGELHLAVQRFETLADMMPQIVWSTLPDGYHDYFNERWYEFTGMPRPDEPGGEDQGWNWKDYLHPDDVAQTVEVWHRSLATGGPYEIRYRFRRASDGAYRWFIARAVPIRDVHGSITRWFGTCTDIEEQYREEEKLERLVAERTAVLQEQAERLQALASALTSAEQRERKRLAALLHDDLQQLLFAAHMMLQMALLRPDPESVSAFIADADEQIRQAVEAARSLTRQLRPPALYESGLVPALEWLAADMAERHSLSVVVTARRTNDDLNDDARALLFECARELLFNVVKYAGTGRAAVEVGAELGWVRLVVTDEGRGFDVESLADQKHQSFGLFSIRERVAALGGSVMVHSRIGGGTRIELAVPQAGRAPLPSPAAQGEAGPLEGAAVLHQATPSRSGDAETSPPPPTAPRITVLVVDDHTLVRQGLSAMINAEAGMEVVGGAADGLEALEMVGRLRPDVVLMDLNMPRMNGIEATRAVVARWPDVSVVGLSMHEDDVTAQSMVEAGAVAFLPKAGAAVEMLRTIAAAATKAA